MTRELAPAGLEGPLRAAQAFADAGHADETKRGYRGDVRRWNEWCRARGVAPVPVEPRLAAAYLATLAEGHRVATIERALASLSYLQRAAGHPPFRADPIVQAVRRGIRRKLGVAQEGKAPLVIGDLSRVCHAMPGWVSALRDRALILVGWAGAFRRSELASLLVSDLEREPRGMLVHLRRSKTDQEGAGRIVAIPYGSDPCTCPVRALDDWLRRSGITEGPVFRPVDQWGHMATAALRPAAVAIIVKRWAASVGLDPAHFAGHSLRAGLATSAAAAGKSERAIMQQTGHRSYQMVRRYIRRASVWDECAAAGIGL